MRVRALDKINDFDPVERRDIHMEKDDVLTVRDAMGAHFCKHGWAEDVDGVHPTGERKEGAHTLSPEDLKSLQQ